MRNIGISIKQQIGVAMEENLIKYIDEVAKKKGMTRSDALRTIIKEHRATDTRALGVVNE